MHHAVAVVRPQQPYIYDVRTGKLEEVPEATKTGKARSRRFGMKMINGAVLIAAMLAPVAAAQAQSWLYDEGPYVGFSAGATSYDIDVRNWDDGSLTAGSVDDSDVGVKFYFGYRLSRNFGFELFYTNLGETAFEGVSSGDGSAWSAGEISGFTKNSGYGFSVIAGAPIGSSVDLFAKAGMFRWSVRHREFDSGGSYRFSDNGSDIMLGAGISFDVSERNALRLEWERYTDVYDIYDVDFISVGFINRF